MQNSPSDDASAQENKPANASPSPAAPLGSQVADVVASALANAPEGLRREYEEARNELALLSAAIAEIAKAQDESTALELARAVRSRVARIAVRWCRARRLVGGGQIDG